MSTRPRTGSGKLSAVSFRKERDTLGEVRVPDDALYGAQTQRAVENYPISGLREHPLFIRAFILLKKAAALANRELGAMDADVADSIVAACDDVARQRREVSAALRRRRLPGRRRNLVQHECERGDRQPRQPTRGASARTSRSIRTITSTWRSRRTTSSRPRSASPRCCCSNELFPQLDALAIAFDDRGNAFADVIKSGRTHLQDAVPSRSARSFAPTPPPRAAPRASSALPRDELRDLGIGGTAVGTGMNAPRGYRHVVVRRSERADRSRSRRRRRSARVDAVAASGRRRLRRAAQPRARADADHERPSPARLRTADRPRRDHPAGRAARLLDHARQGQSVDAGVHEPGAASTSSDRRPAIALRRRRPASSS